MPGAIHSAGIDGNKAKRPLLPTLRGALAAGTWCLDGETIGCLA